MKKKQVIKHYNKSSKNSFERSEERQRMIKELTYTKLMDKKVKFSCYHDGIMVFELKEEDKTLHNFSVICDDDFWKGMTVTNLLESKKVGYFEHSVYLIDRAYGVDGNWEVAKEEYKRAISVTYNSKNYGR